MLGDEQEPGIIPRAIDDIFSYIEKVSCVTTSPLLLIHQGYLVFAPLLTSSQCFSFGYKLSIKQ